MTGEGVYSSTKEMFYLYINREKNHHKRNSNSNRSRACSEVSSYFSALKIT